MNTNYVPPTYIPSDARAGRKVGLDDRYVAALALVLAGYAIVGKGFAYLGVPPLYMGEIMFLWGTAVALCSGCLPATLSSIPSLVLVTFIALVAAACVRDVGRFGMDTLRDSVIAIYGVYAFIVAALLVDKPERIEIVIGYFRRFTTWFILCAPALLVLSFMFAEQLPRLVANSPFFFVRPGEAAVHLAGAMTFSLLGFRRETWLTSLMLVLAAGLVMAESRGGMMSFIIPTALAAVFAKDKRQIMRFAMLALLIGAIGAAGTANLKGFQGRSLDINQAVANVTSIFSSSDTGNLDGTKAFRMNWWKDIVNYTFHGDYFWTGKGFGINLAEADGFVVGRENGGGVAPLRSPHNGHFTVLARAGVPGLVLWALLLVTWAAMMGRNAWAAFARGEPAWARFFVFIVCYVISIVIDASFDVALEGPMIGIWFWTMIGMGIGTSLVYWARRPARSALRMAC